MKFIKQSTLILITGILFCSGTLHAQERYTDFSAAFKAFKAGKITANRFPNGGAMDRLEFSTYVLDKATEKYLNYIKRSISFQTNYGNGCLIFNYQSVFVKDRDYRKLETTITGPVKPEYINNKPLADSLYGGKVFFEEISGGAKYNKPVRKLVSDFYDGNYTIGDTVDLGTFNFPCKLNTEIGDTIWFYDQSQTGYPDNKKFIELYGKEELNKEEKWREVISLDEFKAKHVRVLSKYRSRNFVLKHNVRALIQRSKNDSLNVTFKVLGGFWVGVYNRYIMNFDDEVQEIYNSQNAWHLGTSRNVDLLYNLFIANCVAQHKREVLSADRKKAEENRQKAEKQELYKKYGKANVDAAYVFSPRVGMPEDLLNLVLQMWTPTKRSSFSGGYTLYCKGVLDASAHISITVRNGKVSNYYTY